MKLKVIYWCLFNKKKYNLYRILHWIKRAKRYYLKGKCNGLCFAFANTVPKHLSDVYFHAFSYNRTRYFIPEYYPEYFGTKEIDEGFSREYWWPIEDRTSRIKALDKLIEVYKKKLQ